MIIALQLVLLLLMLGSTIYYAWCALCMSQFFAAEKPETSPNGQPVSILIPVCGVEEGDRENWESLLLQDYEHYEVLFGVMDSHDSAVPILEELVARFADRARLLVGLEVRGINYQVSNLMHLLEAAQHEVVVFVDSDMRVTPDYLVTVTAPLANPEIGVVTCPYVAHNPKYLAAALAAMGRCIDFIPSMLINRILEGGMQSAFGSTIATRKSVLEKIGGLQSLVNRNATDYYIGNLAAKAGYQVYLSQYVVETGAELQSIQQLFLRELRWAIVSRKRNPVYYGLVWTYGTVYCIPLLLLSGFQHWAIIACSVTIGVRIVQAIACMWSMGCPKLILWIWALPLRDLMSFIIWVAGTRGQSVYWRGRRLWVGADGLLTE